MNFVHVPAFQVDLTEDWLLSQDPPFAPIVAGDDYDLRFLVTDEADEPVSLAGAAAALAVKKTDAPDAPIIFTRDTATDCAGAPGVKQIAFDADQATYNETTRTGKGCGTIRFRPGDLEILLLAVALRYWDFRVRFGNGSVRLVMAGRFQVRRARTPNTSIPA